MSPERKAAIEALRPFAELADLAEQLPAHMREDGFVLLSLGGRLDQALRTRHLQDARDALRQLEAP